MKPITDENYSWLREKEEKLEGWPDPFNMSFPVSSDWNKKGKRKILVILDSVFSPDLKNKRMMANKDTEILVRTIFDEAEKAANTISKNEAIGWDRNIAYSFVNFNYFPWFAIKDVKKLRIAYSMAAKRIQSIIKKLEPTCIIICGDQPAQILLKENSIHLKRGWINKYEIGSKKLPCTNTISIDSRTWKGKKIDGPTIARTNLLGYAVQNIAYGLLGKHPYSLDHIKPNAKIIDSSRSAKAMIKDVTKAKTLGIDTETKSLSVFSDILVAQFSTEENSAWVLPITHKDCKLSNNLLNTVRGELADILCKKRRYWQDADPFSIGHNIGFDLKVLLHWLQRRYWYYPIWDTMAGEFCLNENIKQLPQKNVYRLLEIFATYKNNYYALAKFSKENRMDLVNTELKDSALDYCSMDAQVMLGIQRMQLNRAISIDNLGESYGKIYKNFMLVHMCSMVRVTSTMENRGTMLDLNWMLHLADPKGPLTNERENIKKRLYADENVRTVNKKLIQQNVRYQTTNLLGNKKTWLFDESKWEHKKILFIDVLGLDPLAKSKKTGKPSFGEEFLEAYSHHNSVECYQQMAKLQKLKSTYVDRYLKLMAEYSDSALDHRMRPRFLYYVAVSGRTTSSDPNMQQIPIHGNTSKIIKRMLITPPMALHYEADYSIHEIRMWSVLSKDNLMVKLFIKVWKIILDHREKQTKETAKRMKEEGDPHRQNYSTFTGKPLRKVTDDDRQDSKGITFGTIFGMQDKSLASKIKKSMQAAKKIRLRFFKKYKKAGKFLEDSEKQGREKFYVVSPLGRRRNLHGYMARSGFANMALDRMARNSIIQGIASDIAIDAADLFTRALGECYDILLPNRSMRAPSMGGVADNYMPYGPNCMVHDSIKGESHFKYYLLTLHILEWAMVTAVPKFLEKYFGFKMLAPFNIEIEIGSSWAQKTKWDFTDKGKRQALMDAVEGHKKVHKDNKSVGKLNTKKVVDRMFMEYEKQTKILKLDKNFPLPI